MLINILHPAFNSTVSCNNIATEGYEPSNLVSADMQKARLGFLAYSCVKPPVDLTFNFPCAFNIQFISIWPAVASQKSVGFMILTELSGTSNTVASGYINDEPGVLFYRADVFSKQKIENIPVPRNFYKTTLRNASNQMSNCSNIIVRIMKTANSSVPAISKLEIWGFVSKVCPRHIVSKIHQIWTDNIKSENHTSTANHAMSKVSDVPNKSRNNISETSNKTEVPEEFLDLITYNIMSMPLVLPSGKIIDQDTLDKHIKHEATWGRPPSDPFTGQPFTTYRKPFLSFALKGKIDQFLLQNSSNMNFFNIPRTTGHYAPNQLSNSDKMVKNEEITTFISASERKVNCEASSSRTPNKNVVQKYSGTFPKNKVNDSLKAKHKFKLVDRKSLIIRACYNCNLSEKLLKIYCGHFICRTCILNSEDLTCKNCGLKFNKTNVQHIL